MRVSASPVRKSDSASAPRQCSATRSVYTSPACAPAATPLPIPDSPSSDSRRGAVLRAALGFLALEPRAPELQLLHRCFDSWRGVGDVVVRMERQGYRLHLTNIEPGTWRATFSHDAMSAAEGFA